MVPEFKVNPAVMLTAMPKALRTRFTGKPIRLNTVAVTPKNRFNDFVETPTRFYENLVILPRTDVLQRHRIPVNDLLRIRPPEAALPQRFSGSAH